MSIDMMDAAGERLGALPTDGAIEQRRHDCDRFVQAG